MLLLQRRRKTYLLCKETDRLLVSQREWKLEQSFCGNHAIHINKPESKHMFSFWKFIKTNYWKGPNSQTLVSFTRTPPWIAWIWIHKCLKWTGHRGMQEVCAAGVHLTGMEWLWTGSSQPTSGSQLRPSGTIADEQGHADPDSPIPARTVWCCCNTCFPNVAEVSWPPMDSALCCWLGNDDFNTKIFCIKLLPS